MGFLIVMPAYARSEVADSGLAGRPTLRNTRIGDGVIHVDGTAHDIGVGEDVGGVAQQELFAQAGWDLVAVDRDVSGG